MFFQDEIIEPLFQNFIFLHLLFQLFLQNADLFRHHLIRLNSRADFRCYHFCCRWWIDSSDYFRCLKRGWDTVRRNATKLIIYQFYLTSRRFNLSLELLDQQIRKIERVQIRVFLPVISWNMRTKIFPDIFIAFSIQNFHSEMNLCQKYVFLIIFLRKLSLEL